MLAMALRAARTFRKYALSLRPSRASTRLQSALGALAAFARAFFTVFMVLGAGFTAVVFAVTRDRMLAEFAVTFRAVADAFTVNHESDS